MDITSLQRSLPSDSKQRRETPVEALTAVDIDTDAGKGPAADLSDCTFHASSEDFLAAVDACLDGPDTQ